MATTKKYDVAVKVGSYTDSQGNEKARYKNIGAIWQKEDGGTYLALDSTIITMELQYLCNPKRSERIVCSMFEPRESEKPASRSASQGKAAPSDAAPPKTKSGTGFDDMSDDIPF